MCIRDSPDLEVRFDNTIKYNLMSRVESQDKDVTNSANPNLFDDADLGFDKGIVSNRFDLLSELEVVWKQNFGFRVSAASWHDQAYGDSNDHPGLNKDFRINGCLLYTSPSPRDRTRSRMPSSA